MTFRKVPPGPRRPPSWLPLLAVVLLAACSGPFPQSTLIPKGDFAQHGGRSVHDDGLVGRRRLRPGRRGAALRHLEVPRPARRSGAGADPRQHRSSRSSGRSSRRRSWRSSRSPPSRRSSETSEIRRRRRDAGRGDRSPVVVGVPLPGAQQIVTANEMHRPGRPARRLVKIRPPRDVLHCFWIPQFAGQARRLPAEAYTTFWFKADSPGAFTGQCAEFCGVQHGRMGSLVVVADPGGVRRLGGRRSRSARR